MKKTILKIATAALLIAPFGMAAIAHAATYAYVNSSGNVSTVTASGWQTALATAPNIGLHSGVMLLISQLDFDIVGDSI